MSEKDIALILIRDALENQKSECSSYTEANENPVIRNTCKSAVASTLEFLNKKEVVEDFQSTFGESGHGFAYRLNSSLIIHLVTDELILQKINELFEPEDEIPVTISEIAAAYSELELNVVYKEDLLRNLKELKICYSTGCYIACLALCEQILEIALMKVLDDNKNTFDHNWMSKDSHFLKYFDQPLTEKAIVINKTRTVARKKVKSSIPTRYQAAMEIRTIVDILKSIR